MDLSTLDLLKRTAPELTLNDKEELKSFTFRALSPALHSAWKTCAAMACVSMEEFGVAAIREYIKQAMIKEKEARADEKTG